MAAELLRKDDILYNVLDFYTGEPCTYTKVTTLPNGTPITDADVDNIIYIKRSTEYFRRSFANKVNVKWFGAKGDNDTDDTLAIQKAIDTLVRMGGGDLFVPSGIYLSQKITLSPRINVEGEGRGVSIIKLLDNQDTDLLYLPKTSFINKLSNITFDANRDNNTLGSAIRLESNTNADGGKVDALFDKSLTGTSTYRYLDIIDVCVTRGAEYGLYIPAANYLVHINGLYAYKNRRGFLNLSTDNIFTNLVAERNDIYGLRESGGNNKWSSLKVIWNGIARTEPGFNDYFGGLVISNGRRSSFLNGECQDNFGPGAWLVDSSSLVIDVFILDSNCYLNSSLVTDGVSSGIRLDNVQDSMITAMGTNYKETLDRPWPQPRAFSEDHRCTNNQINITSRNQETNPITVSDNLVNTHDIICKRNSEYVGINKTFAIDEPISENGVLITENERISIPSLIPFRNEVSFILDFEYLTKTSSNPVLFNNGGIKLEYITDTGTNHLKVTYTTDSGVYTSNDLNFTLVGNGFYRVYSGLRRISTGGARIDLSLSYTIGSAVQFISSEYEFTGTSHLFGIMGNSHFNDYDSSPGSTVGNVRMRLIRFALFPEVLPLDYTKFSYKIHNLEKAYIYMDFSKPFGNKSNVLLDNLVLPEANEYYLNKVFITNEGIFVCIQLEDSSYKFVGLTSELDTLTADLAIRPERINVTDFDDPLGYKFLQGTDTSLNAPTSAEFYQGIQVASTNSDAYANQLVFDLNGNPFTRSKLSNTWRQWERFGSFFQAPVAKTANYTATIYDKTLLFNAASGALTCTLPPLSVAYRNGEGLIMQFKKTDSSTNAVLIDGNGSETIDGSTGFSLTVQNQAIVIQATSTGWMLLDVYIPNPVRVASVTGSGNGTTAITVTHGLGYIPVIVNVLATNSAAAGITYVTATSTTFTVNYAVAPSTGTNNLAYNFSYRRP